MRATELLERSILLAAVAAALTVAFIYLGGRLGWTTIARKPVLVALGLIVFCAVFGSTVVRGSDMSPFVGGLLGSVAGLAAARLYDKVRRFR